MFVFVGILFIKLLILSSCSSCEEQNPLHNWSTSLSSILPSACAASFVPGGARIGSLEFATTMTLVIIPKRAMPMAGKTTKSEPSIDTSIGKIPDTLSFPSSIISSVSFSIAKPSEMPSSLMSCDLLAIEVEGVPMWSWRYRGEGRKLSTQKDEALMAMSAIPAETDAVDDGSMLSLVNIAASGTGGDLFFWVVQAGTRVTCKSSYVPWYPYYKRSHVQYAYYELQYIHLYVILW